MTTKSTKFSKIFSLFNNLQKTLHKIITTLNCPHSFNDFIGLAYQGKDIVFRFIIEYSSLMDFGP